MDEEVEGIVRVGELSNRIWMIRISGLKRVTQVVRDKYGDKLIALRIKVETNYYINR